METVDLSPLLDAWRRGAGSEAQEILAALSPAERYRVGMELYNRRELDLLPALIPRDCVHDMRPTGIPGMDVYRGPGEYRRFIDQWLDAFPDATLEEEELEVSGDVVFGVIRQTTHGRASGLEVDFRYAAVVEYRDGGMRRSWFDTDIDRARGLYRELAATAGQRG